MTPSSNSLIHFIREKIAAAGGQLSFDQFMGCALYHPEFGYYNSARFDIGKEGDFITAPEISPLFAQCFARQCLQIWATLPERTLLELGAGTGRLARDLLNEFDRLGSPPDHYFIYEPNLGLRKKQQACLPSARVQWLDHLPSEFSGVIVANEVLDALPVHCFRIDRDGVKERCVMWENNEFQWKISVPTSAELREEIVKLCDLYGLETGYESEINLNLSPFIQAIAAALKAGAIFFIDYGYGQREYYHPQRRQGTLTCFYQHRHHANPLISVGLQDITAHVDFTRVAESAVQYGCDVLGYTTQAAFLLACGLMELAAEAEKNLSAADEFALHQAIKLLTLPTEMGERIKVMALGKQLGSPLVGFDLQDRRRDL
ncbi:MAG: SAM-dependent methyltransferase [Gammaproteobacteria bacterium]|nr:MAG: SAM-dependent methyltransferase [Gammaproteobacteria bacterium]